ncbi:MAG: hypothetical protein WC682_03020 [Parcubacteria group bacterium]
MRFEIAGQDDGDSHHILTQLMSLCGDIFSEGILIAKSEQKFKRITDDFADGFESGMPCSMVMVYLEELSLDIVRLIKKQSILPYSEVDREIKRLMSMCELPVYREVQAVKKIVRMKKTFHVEFVEVVHCLLSE